MVVTTGGREQLVRVPAGGPTLDGILAVPAGARGVVVFAHGSGSGDSLGLFRLANPRYGSFGLSTRDERKANI